jgi:general stress protein YciG
MTEELREHLRELGRKGGKRTVEKYGKEFMSRIGKRGVNMRRRGKKLSTGEPLA